jgi:glutathione synthase/RimK-type ligase-like ATP-grasp enzyme
MPARRGRALDLVVLGNPGNRRLALLDRALVRCGRPPARVLPYVDYLRGKLQLADMIREGSVFRIESPGQDFEAEREILAAGIGRVPEGAATRLDRAALDQLAFERGRVYCPKQWFLGYSQVLARIQRDRALCPAHMVMNDEASIAVLFDKSRCHDWLTSRAIACPRALGPVHSYDELRCRMRAAGVGRVFVKLACGSSGSGVVALESSGPRTQAFTTAEMVEQGGRLLLYNSRRIRRIGDERSIARLVDTLAAEGVHVEPWVPKAGLDGHAFDVRVVVIAGRPEHAVVRLSRSPITNLHLKNRRGRVEALQERMGASAWESLLATCRQVAAAFPGCHYLGVDVAVLPGYRRHAVLEVNAFGDLLPDVLDGAGRDTYTAEVESLLESRPSLREGTSIVGVLP